ncbi:MAG TPA: MFS transporter [Candidatus Acidoferrales bacterium]|jgi:MFS family permease|nr:MFS transporter [Candidatus Acidoferrales bacterium]
MGLFPTGFGAKFWCLIGATFLGFLGIGTVLPGLAPHVRRDLGGSDQTVGLVIGVFSFVALGARFFSGPLADNRGRKAAFLTGLMACAAAGICYLLPLGIVGAYLGRIFQGFGEACLYTGAAAWAVELAGVHRSGQVLGYLSSGIWGGISAGPVVGQWLGSFERAAVMQVVAALMAFAILTRVPEEYRPAARPVRRRLVPASIVAPGISIGFVNVHYPVVAGFLILHLARFGNAGPVAFTAYASLILVSRFFLGGLPDRIHPAITYYGGISLMALGLVLVALAPTAAVALGGTALLGFGFSFPWSSVASTVLRRTPEQQRGSALGVLTAFYDLFVGIGSLAAGAIANRFGYAAAFLMAAAAIGASAVSGRYVFRGHGAGSSPGFGRSRFSTDDVTHSR